MIGEDGRLHTTFNQAVAATGRLSTSNPNLQAIPIRTELGREIRSAFVAEPGWKLVSADYSQVELRILAHVSGEPKLREAFARGEDIHAATAAEVLGRPQAELTKDERNIAKMVNFGIIYGISAFGLSENLEIPREEAQTYIDAYLARFPHVQDFIARTIEQCARDGYVTTLLGRRRPVPEIRASNRQTRSLGERLAVNSVMQGTAADVIKVAMVSVPRAGPRGWCSRCTTNCCSRRPTRRCRPPARRCARRCAAPIRSTPRSPSTWAWGTTGTGPNPDLDRQ
jgi:DNA polymerase-1